MKKYDDIEIVPFEEIACPASPIGIAFANRMRIECLTPIRESFREYETVHFGINRVNSQNFDFEYDQDRNHGTDKFTHGGIWWAYRFGFSDKMPKNDVPNISIIANTTGLEVIINAELQSSQKVMINRIRANPSIFDRLLADHGMVWLKTYLKYEHQPRFYHWMLADIKSPGEFGGEDILQIRRTHEENFKEERKKWLRKIFSGNTELSDRQIRHLKNQNKNLNLAIRLVQPFQKDAAIWHLQPKEQVNDIVTAVQRMKPLVDFFVR